MHLKHVKSSKKKFLKRGIWHLGGRKKQKGGFLPILGSLAKPLLVSAAGAIGWGILKGVGSKIFRRGKRISKRRRRIGRLSYAQKQYFIAKDSCTKTSAITKW